MVIPKQPQTNPRKLSPLSERCQKLTHLRKTRFPHLPLLKACFGFGFGSGFVGLRRWSENFDWGRVGLVSRRASRRTALAPPPASSHRAKNFSPPSNPLKLNNHPIFWAVVQFVLSIKRWNKLMEASDCARYMQLCDRRSVFEYCSVIGQFCPIGGQFCRAING